MNDAELQEFLRKAGFVHALLRIAEKELTIGDLVRDKFNPEGVASEGAVRSVRKVFMEYELVEEVPRKDPSRRGRESKYLVITPKGKRVARALRKLNDELES